MSYETLKSRLQNTGAIFLGGKGQDEPLRIVDQYARAVCEITPYQSEDEEEIISQVQSFLSAVPAEKNPQVRLSIHVVYEALARPETGPVLVKLAELLSSSAKAKLIFHLDQPTTDFSALRSTVKFVRQNLANSKELGVELSAPFSEFVEAEMEELFNLGVRIRFAAGWTRGCPPGQVLSVDPDVLRAFSEYGFRTPIEWYVHSDNIPDFNEQIADLLLANYSSGFALPLVSENPFYKFDPSFPALPDSTDYCQLLVRNYKKHPYYDDVLYPLNSLALMIREGAWNSKLNSHTNVNLLLDAEGNIGLYQNSPALARTWIRASEVTSLNIEALQERFVQFSRESRKQDAASANGNPWLQLCGAGVPSGCDLTPQEIATMSDYRKLFLEHFASLRGADRVFGPAPQVVVA